MMLICPFLGWGGIVSEIEDAGGVKKWTRTTEDESDWQRLIWSWIKRYGEEPERYPPIWLGYGENDFLTGDGPVLLANVLKQERSFSRPGGHSYGTFKTVFLEHLDRLDKILRGEEALP